jgi:hypothetical protein
MPRPEMDRDLARAAATDAANRQMRAAGRKVWSREDYDLACEMFARLWPEKNSKIVLDTNWKVSHTQTMQTKAKHPGGRPKTLTPCPYCRAKLGAREFRAHVNKCPKRK